MRLTATYKELVAVEFPIIKKEEFNNTLSSLIFKANSDEQITEVFLVGFQFEHLREMFKVIKNATKTGIITFEREGVLYTKSKNELCLNFDEEY